jgi:hypothetical protein
MERLAYRLAGVLELSDLEVAGLAMGPALSGSAGAADGDAECALVRTVAAEFALRDTDGVLAEQRRALGIAGAGGTLTEEVATNGCVVNRRGTEATPRGRAAAEEDVRIAADVGGWAAAGLAFRNVRADLSDLGVGIATEVGVARDVGCRGARADAVFTGQDLTAAVLVGAAEERIDARALAAKLIGATL